MVVTLRLTMPHQASEIGFLPIKLKLYLHLAGKSPAHVCLILTSLYTHLDTTKR